MKYRRLTKEELEPLAEDFAIFLASNSIDKKAWDNLKGNEPQKAEETLDIFSDMVFEKALKSARFLERISETEIHCYAFQSNQAHLISARITQPGDSNFVNSELKSLLPRLIKNNSLELIQGTKKYSKPREQEMFEIMKTGATFSKGELYNALLRLI